MNNPQQILTNAIKRWQPKALVSLYSGGYDSAVTTHLLHTLDTHGLPVHVWAIDTQLSADGWGDYVQSVARELRWNFNIHDNLKGFGQAIETVRKYGCPRSRKMHTYFFEKLKGRGIEAVHMLHKSRRSDKTLFVSGMRRDESAFRKEAAEVERIGHSNRIFAAPIVHWSQEDCDVYRVENGLPDNPFYGTVKGSGDCQCNWGNFIKLPTLRKHSPKLARGNVALIDNLSKDIHGFGWHSSDVVSPPQPALVIPGADESATLTTPFLCQGCSRAKVRAPAKRVEEVLLQRGLF